MARTAFLTLAASAVTTASQSDTVTATVTNQAINRVVSDFIGISFEINAAPKFFNFAGGIRQSYVNLLSTLQVQSNADGPNIRIGGGSADWNAYLPDNEPLPPGYVDRINDTQLAMYAPAINAFKGTMTLDVTMRNATDPSLAVAHVAAIGRVIGWDAKAASGRYLIDGVEIGNEVDTYWNYGIRPANDSYSDYQVVFDRYISALQGAGGLPDRVQGAVFCCNVARFDAGLLPNATTGQTGYIARYGRGTGGSGLLSSISYHRYPVWYVTDVNYSIYWLLSDEASYDYISYLRPFVQAANASNIQFYIGEGGGASSNGTNVVDVFAVCLWAVDTLFHASSIGIQRWNFHGGPNDWLGPIMYLNDTVDVPTVRPLWYAMWLFAEASANSSTIYSVNVSSTNEYIKAWAVQDANGYWRVVLVHKDPNPVPSVATVSVVPPAPLSGSGSLKRLLSSPLGLNAKDGISWGGQTYDGTTDGLPLGQPTTEPVQTDAQGRYTFDLPSYSVAVLALPTT